jgi:hypothetical protein
LLDSVVKERWVDSFVSTEARILQRPLYLSSDYFQKFQSFLINFNHLRLDQLCVARQREANSTALQPRVKLFFLTAVDQPDRRRFFADLTVKTLQLVDLQGFFVSVCAGSGANYREIQERVNR